MPLRLYSITHVSLHPSFYGIIHMLVSLINQLPNSNVIKFEMCILRFETNMESLGLHVPHRVPTASPQSRIACATLFKVATSEKYS